MESFYEIEYKVMPINKEGIDKIIIKKHTRSLLSMCTVEKYWKFISFDTIH